MIFDKYDFEVLRLCGVCRYLPTGLMRKFDVSYFKSGVIGTLKDRGYIKTQSDKLSYKLTKEGKRVLAEMGYIFPDDVRMNIKRQAYTRKLKNALWNVTLHLAGIDIFGEKASSLAEMKNGYISSLTIRADEDQKVLAGTRFLGVLKINDSAYIPYFLSDENEWIIPGYENDTFISQIDSIKCIKKVNLVITGNSLEELWKCLHPEGEGSKLIHGQVRFNKALEELGHDCLLIPSGRNGVFQMKILTSSRYRERLAEALGCTIERTPDGPVCDGIKNGIPYIIAVDLNINRIIRLLKRLKSYDANLVPRICCLSFQKKTIYKLLKFYDMQKTRILTIDNESVMNIFAEIKTYCCKKEAYITKEGKNVDANIQKSERKDNEEIEIDEDLESD